MTINVPYRLFTPQVDYTAKAMDNQGTAAIYTGSSSATLPDTKVMTLSCWFKPNGVPTDRDMLMQGRDSGIVKMEMNVTGSDIGMLITLDNTVLGFDIPDGTIIADAWNHLIISVDMGNDLAGIYHNGVDIQPDITWTAWSDSEMRFASLGDYAFSVCSHKGLSIRFFNGSISDFWWGAEYVDLGNDLDKFINGSGKAINLGSDGSTPTGRQPEIYFPCDYTNPGANAGSVIDYSVSGTFINDLDSPSI